MQRNDVRFLPGTATHVHVVVVYVIAWFTVVFGINSTSNASRKGEIARGEAECYF